MSDEAQEAAREAAAVLANQRWDAASPKVDLAHKYLVSKRVALPEGIRQEGDLLLIPLKALEDNRIVSLQTIAPDGTKLYLKDGRTTRTRTTIGMNHLIREEDTNDPARDQTIYVAEGWATGYTIAHVMQAPVVVAFSTSNLRHVVEYLIERYVRKYGFELIVAADNDRWTGQAGVNVARKAVHPPFGRVAIPDFKPEHLVLPPGETKGPTDFNDLFILEGPEAVRYWLQPDHAREAVISVPGAPDIEPEPELDKADDTAPPPPPPDEKFPWYDRAPFRCLGYDHDTYFYLPREKGQVAELTAAAHDRKTLLPLAPLDWWQDTFPSKKEGINWTEAANALLRRSHLAGVFQHSQIRGRGCWPDEDGVILHLGDRLLAPGGKSFVDPETFTCSQKLTYERKAHLIGPSTKRAMPLEEAKRILGLFEDLAWHEGASAYLLAGWTALAPVCGALPWRPHVFLLGSTGSGKTTIVRDLILPLLGGSGQYFEGGTTEAGIRQKLRADALPVVYDEAEAVDIRTDARIQQILGLARSASSTGAETAKGTTGGKAMTFQTRSMFCFAAIGGAVRQEADKTRIALLQLRSPSDVGAEERRVHWARWAPKVKQLTSEHGRELFARTLQWLRSGRLREALAIFTTQASVLLGNARAGDQYGTLYAGAWTLQSDDVPSEQEAREFISNGALDAYIADQAPEGIRVIDVILQQLERIDTSHGPKMATVGQLIEACRKPSEYVREDDARNRLRQIGIRIDARRDEMVLVLANKSEWIARALRDSPYAANIQAAFRTIKHAEAGGTVNFGGFYSRATLIPLRSIDNWWITAPEAPLNGSAPGIEVPEAEATA